MKRAMFYLTIVLIAIIGLGHSNNVSALYISAPNINSVSYVSENEIKLNYNTNNINSSYKVQIFNSTLGKIYTAEVNTTSYNVKELTFGKTYNFLMRVYYRVGANTYVSNWSNIVSGTPKANAPVINSITSGNGTLTLNYAVSGSLKGVQIYLYNTKKSYTTTNLKNHTFTGLKNGTKYKFIIRNYYEGNIYGPWSKPKEGTPKSSTNSNNSSSNNSSSNNSSSTSSSSTKTYYGWKYFTTNTTTYHNKKCDGLAKQNFCSKSSHIGNYATVCNYKSKTTKKVKYEQPKMCKKWGKITCKKWGWGKKSSVPISKGEKCTPETMLYKKVTCSSKTIKNYKLSSYKCVKK